MEFKKENLVKSPLNYTGGKFKLLPQILPLFPDDIDTFVDLFGGGFNVGINTNANNIVYNDIIGYLPIMFKEMLEYDINTILNKIDDIIDKYKLSKTNEEGFKELRKEFNKTKNPLDLYVLSCYSFNYQLRFNNSMEYNSSFGKNRSCFSKNMRKRLIDFLKVAKTKTIDFHNCDYSFIKHLSLDEKDLVYVDCPYLISTASYNDGKRGFGNWTEEKEIDLYKRLDTLNKHGVRFAVSNVIKHKGKENDLLVNWSANYTVHYLDNDYSNCSYQGKNTDKETIEVLITNY